MESLFVFDHFLVKQVLNIQIELFKDLFDVDIDVLRGVQDSQAQDKTYNIPENGMLLLIHALLFVVVQNVFHHCLVARVLEHVFDVVPVLVGVHPDLIIKSELLVILHFVVELIVECFDVGEEVEFADQGLLHP